MLKGTDNHEYKTYKNRGKLPGSVEKIGSNFDAPVGTAEGDEADVLGLLIDEYEKRHYPIVAPDPI